MESGEERGGSLVFLALGSPMVTLGVVVPWKMKAGSLVRVSRARGNEFRRLLWQGLPAALPADCMG